jgi:hypothetical protein
MADPQTSQKPSEKDQLITRPDDPLPAVDDPSGPRGYPADPQPKPKEGQGSDPKAGNLDYTA